MIMAKIPAKRAKKGMLEPGCESNFRKVVFEIRIQNRFRFLNVDSGSHLSRNKQISTVCCDHGMSMASIATIGHSDGNIPKAAGLGIKPYIKQNLLISE